jgi:ATP-dependent DNA ligase
MDARWKPMLCEPAEAMPTSPDGWVLEPKFDGWRAIVHLGDNGVVLYGGRNGNSYSGQVPYIEQALADNLPPNTVLDGELIKRRDGAYMSGRRSPLWRKLKAIASEDCVIVGWEPGKNGRSGELGALIVELPSGVQTTVSGMTDKVRTDMLVDWAKYDGQIVEVAHNGVLDSGKLRHPRYKRLRTDRTPAPTVTPKPADAKSKRPGSPRMRNYKAMKDKLRGVLGELEGRYGDAYQRAVNDPNFSYDEHLTAAREAARAKGLI